MGKIRSHIVGHTHWDREWYFTTADAEVLSDQVFTEVLTELERNPKANFCLDGQSSILDEYLELHPEQLPRIKKFIKEKRLFAGPWYTQTDALMVDGEAILRNLIIGIKDTTNKYGEPMMVGYLPDTFGFNAQLPAYLNHAGIDNFVFWRGINFDKMTKSPYFIWKGLGVQSVYAVNFPFGYMTAMLSIDTEENLEEFVSERLDAATAFSHSHGNNEDVLMPSGIDQKSIVPNLDKILEKINRISKFEHIISTYPDFIECIRNKKNLPEYQGEIREPVYARVHRSIGSVRMKIKLQNFEIEQKIIRRIEPLMVIARSNGVRIGNGILIKLWKKVLECQAHDSIGGCVSDHVAEDILHRLKEANEIADGIENIIGKRIAEGLNLSNNEVIVFNTDPVPFKGEKVIHIVTPNKNIQFDEGKNPIIIWEKYYPSRKDIVKLVPKGTTYFDEPAYYELLVRMEVELPALGYKVFCFSPAKESLPEPVTEKMEQSAQSLRIKNNYYEIEYREQQIHLKTDFIEIPNLVEIVDSANAGDTYDYSPLPGDQEISLAYSNASVIREGKKQTLVVGGTAELPLCLEDRNTDIPNIGRVIFTMKLTIDEDSDFIDGQLILDNQVYSHRLRLKWNVVNPDEKALAQIQNGFVETKTEKIEENWNQNYVEKPVPLYVFDKSVSVADKGNSITLFAKGLKEYERIGSHLYITLMSTTGELGKPNLEWRPGRASGDTTNEGHVMMETPLAQEIGTYVFEFGVCIKNSLLNQESIALKAYQWLSQSISYQLQSFNFFIKRLDNKIWPIKNGISPAREFSQIRLPENLLTAAIYPAYDDENSYILRLANSTGMSVPIPEAVMKDAEVVNALEQPLKRVASIDAYDFLTLKYQY